MLTRSLLVTYVVAILLSATALRAGESWPQFRGVNGTARSVSRKALPANLAPTSHVIWKVAFPPGHSSPIVYSDRIFLTAIRDEKLLTVGLDRKSGKVLWEAEAPHEKLEEIHRIGSHAQATIATDGERVVSFFGSCGLFCYDTMGKLMWQRPMGPFNNEFGAASSPIIVDDWVILCQDHDTDSFLMAMDKATGKTVWRTDRSEFPRNYCTPVIASVDGRREIIVAATLRVVGYDFTSGRELWTVRGIARAACSSPAISDNGTVYIASWAGGGQPGARIKVPTFDDFALERDANNSGTLENSELVEGGPIQRRFSQVDRDKTGTITRGEYEYFRGLFDRSRNVVVAIRPGGTGDVTRSRVAWEFARYVPFVASPLYTGGHVFTVKDGGILTSLDAATGRPVRTKRLRATGNYYSSPVSGDGKVFLLNERGQLTVISAEGDWKVLATADFGEDTYATPAIVDGNIYLRTAGHLYCFGLSAEQGRRPRKEASHLVEQRKLEKGAATQGLALAGDRYYTATSRSICRYDTHWKLLQEKPIRIEGVNHVGAIHYRDGFIWAGLLHGPVNGKHHPNLDRSIVAKIRAADLEVVKTWDITPDVTWIDPVCFDGTHVWVGDLSDLGIHRYRLDEDRLVRDGVFRYPKAMHFSQGIRVVGRKLYTIHTFGDMDGLFEFELPENLTDTVNQPTRVWEIEESRMHLEGFDFIPGHPNQIWHAQGEQVDRYELERAG